MRKLDCMEALNDMNIPHDDCAVIIDGGGKSPLWLQIIADSLGIELVEMKYTDSSFGSTMLSGVAIGIFNNLSDALENCNQKVSTTFPNKRNTEKYRELFKKYKAI